MINFSKLIFTQAGDGLIQKASSSHQAVSASATISFSTIDIVENDFVIIVISSAQSGSASLGITTSGYTELANLYADNTTDNNLYAAYKVMSSSPDTSIQLNTNQESVVIVYVLRGVDPLSPIDTSPITATGTGNSYPDPPAITPTAEDSLIVAIGGASQTVGANQFSSSDLSDFVSTGGGYVKNEIAGIGIKQWTSGSFDPAAFSGSASSTSYGWCALSFAVKPI